MKRHRYSLTYVTHGAFEALMHAREPFGFAELKQFGIDHNAYFEKVVFAYTAEDALTQLRQNEGGWIHKSPIVLHIEALEDEA